MTQWILLQWTYWIDLLDLLHSLYIFSVELGNNGSILLQNAALTSAQPKFDCYNTNLHYAFIYHLLVHSIDGLLGRYHPAYSCSHLWHYHVGSFNRQWFLRFVKSVTFPLEKQRIPNVLLPLLSVEKDHQASTYVRSSQAQRSGMKHRTHTR